MKRYIKPKYSIVKITIIVKNKNRTCIFTFCRPSQQMRRDENGRAPPLSAQRINALARVFPVPEAPSASVMLQTPEDAPQKRLVPFRGPSANLL